jgi:hypothetical protein
MTLIATFVSFAEADDSTGPVTVDIDFAPMNALASVSISALGFSPLVGWTGILDVRVQNAQGVDVEQDFGDVNNVGSIPFSTLPPVVGRSNMTHVTMLVETVSAWTAGLLTVLGTDFAQQTNP